jgi:hypothetical protein
MELHMFLIGQDFTSATHYQRRYFNGKLKM